MTRSVRSVSVGDIDALRLAIRLTARARSTALRAGARQSHQKLCSALKSLQGALRHAEGVITRTTHSGAHHAAFTARLVLRSGRIIARALPTLQAAQALCNRLAQRDDALADLLGRKHGRFRTFEVHDGRSGSVHVVSDLR